MPYHILDELVLVGNPSKLCRHPYPRHPKGCPNFGKKDGCPPGVSRIENVLDLSSNIYVVWNAFDIGAHAKRMWEKHPEWTDNQAYCCLYWQPKARKQLAVEIAGFLSRNDGEWILVKNPEAAGVDVTGTMKRIGIDLEWPPRKVAYQVAIVGKDK